VRGSLAPQPPEGGVFDGYDFKYRTPNAEYRMTKFKYRITSSFKIGSLIFDIQKPSFPLAEERVVERSDDRVSPCYCKFFIINKKFPLQKVRGRNFILALRYKK
jgi:hypothetical protein